MNFDLCKDFGSTDDTFDLAKIKSKSKINNGLGSDKNQTSPNANTGQTIQCGERNGREEKRNTKTRSQSIIHALMIV
jgi:hypothetical protein